MNEENKNGLNTPTETPPTPPEENKGTQPKQTALEHLGQKHLREKFGDKAEKMQGIISKLDPEEVDTFLEFANKTTAPTTTKTITEEQKDIQKQDKPKEETFLEKKLKEAGVK